MAGMNEDEECLVVDGVTYRAADLNEDALAQWNSLKFVEAEIAAMHARLAVYGTAKIAYENALRQALPRSTH